jgi:protein-S-isoprenylcysteine O-methyltransferase Ste14
MGTVYVRPSPFYLSVIAAFASVELTTASYLVFLVIPLIAALAIIIIREEEEQLRSVYGAQFAAYQTRSWRLIPFMY